ncbi:MAG: F0F1 ATP synthase subunit B [Bacteroidia bacterium]|nr:F0F1 ATP synthase subunit B [Bacteroidia bacterium]
MDLVTPGTGLTVWMLITFSILLYLLVKFAWKPILKSLKEREDSIGQALKSAEEAKSQMAQLKSDNESMFKQARVERDVILKEAKDMKDAIVAEARKAAEEEGKRMIIKAQDEISKQKVAAIGELKSQVAAFSVSIAEKLISKKLEDSSEQQQIISSLVKDFGTGKAAVNN